MLCFRKSYFLITCALLLLEVLIALYMHDRFVRPYAGDFLATIFVYCLFSSFVRASAGRVLLAALAFSYLIEGLQYINLLDRLDWHSRAARIIFGSHFEWSDMLAYTLGALMVAGIEYARLGALFTPSPSPSPLDARNPPGEGELALPLVINDQGY